MVSYREALCVTILGRCLYLSFEEQAKEVLVDNVLFINDADEILVNIEKVKQNLISKLNLPEYLRDIVNAQKHCFDISSDSVGFCDICNNNAANFRAKVSNDIEFNFSICGDCTAQLSADSFRK